MWNRYVIRKELLTVQQFSKFFNKKKKLIDAKINYIKLLFFVELHTDINIDIDDFILLWT